MEFLQSPNIFSYPSKFSQSIFSNSAVAVSRNSVTGKEHNTADLELLRKLLQAESQCITADAHSFRDTFKGNGSHINSINLKISRECS